MLSNGSATRSESPHEDTDAPGPSAPGSESKSSCEGNEAGRAGPAIRLAHDYMLEDERCQLWHDEYRPQGLIAKHWATECARLSLLADQMAGFRQAELERQARKEEYKWTRRQRRRARDLGVKLKTRPAEAVERPQTLGSGIKLLRDAFQRLIEEVRSVGYLTADVAAKGLQVCGCTQEPAAIACNALAYTLLINNFGCTPGVSPADIAPWLEAVRRPAGLRDWPRPELMGADPDECVIRVLAALEGECERLDALALRVHEEVDVPSLCEALNRVAILNDKPARLAARAHTEARATFARASKDLLTALDREQSHSSSVTGHRSSATGRPAAKGAAQAKPPVPGEAGAPVEEPPTADRRMDGFFPPKPENT